MKVDNQNFEDYLNSMPLDEIKDLVSLFKDTIRMKEIFSLEDPSSKEMSELGDIMCKRPEWETWHFFRFKTEDLQMALDYITENVLPRTQFKCRAFVRKPNGNNGRDCF